MPDITYYHKGFSPKQLVISYYLMIWFILNLQLLIWNIQFNFATMGTQITVTFLNIDLVVQKQLCT